MDKRVFELALEALEQKKLAIEAEMQSLQSELRGVSKPKAAVPTAGRKRMSSAQRKALSERMKAYWAAKRGQVTKAKPAKKAAPAKPKMGSMSAAARKALSLRMKAYWKQKKAALAKEAKKLA